MELQEQLDALRQSLAVARSSSSGAGASSEDIHNSPEMQVVRGQMQVLMSRLMGLGVDTKVTEREVKALQAAKAVEDAAAVDLARSLSEDWEEESPDAQGGACQNPNP